MVSSLITKGGWATVMINLLSQLPSGPSGRNGARSATWLQMRPSRLVTSCWSMVCASVRKIARSPMYTPSYACIDSLYYWVSGESCSSGARMSCGLVQLFRSSLQQIVRARIQVASNPGRMG